MSTPSFTPKSLDQTGPLGESDIFTQKGLDKEDEDDYTRKGLVDPEQNTRWDDEDGPISDISPKNVTN